MNNQDKIHCFRADYFQSTQFNEKDTPAWLSLDINWQGYRIYTLPWIANVARVLGLLSTDDTPEAWISYLESLGLKDVIPVCCEEFFEDKPNSGC